MYFCYFDESGDYQYGDKSTICFCLGAIIIQENQWLETLNGIIRFRRYLSSDFKIPTRCELKANWLIHNKGPIKKLRITTRMRFNAYKSCMRFQNKCSAFKTFAIVINKREVEVQRTDPRDYAWTRAIERLERFGTKQKKNLKIFPDEGHNSYISKKLRLMRRHHSVKSAFNQKDSLNREAINILEDPSDRNSRKSYFIQFADLNAYAAFRKIHPSPHFGEEYWDELGGSRIEEVNKLRGGSTGIVSWP